MKVDNNVGRFVDNNVGRFVDNVGTGVNSVVTNFNSVVENVPNSSIETPPPVAVSVLNRKFSEIAFSSNVETVPSATANKPLVTFTNQVSIIKPYFSSPLMLLHLPGAPLEGRLVPLLAYIRLRTWAQC